MKLWEFIDRAMVEVLGQGSLFSKFKLPGWSFMYPLGRVCEVNAKPCTLNPKP